MNFKVRCTRGVIQFTTGKIYEVKDGKITPDKGYFENVCSIQDLNAKALSKFELVEEEKMFSKSDLKVGYVVEDRSGDVSLFALDEKGDEAFYGGTMDIDNFKADLTDKDNDDDYDIVKVYGLPSKCEDVAKVSKNNRPIVWEREELTLEISIEEIAKKYGVPTDRIRIKE